MNRATDDLISRTVLIDELMAGCMPLDLPGLSGVTGDELTIRNYIDSAPSVDAVPVVHGMWITNKYGETVCSECNDNALQVLTGCLINRHFESYKSKFCPHCGAKMEVKNA